MNNPLINKLPRFKDTNILRDTVRVMVELPTNWLNEEQGSDLLYMLGEFKKRFKERVYDKAVEEALKKIKIPKIKISPKEIKAKMLEILAEKALNNE